MLPKIKLPLWVMERKRFIMKLRLRDGFVSCRWKPGEGKRLKSESARGLVTFWFATSCNNKCPQCTWPATINSMKKKNAEISGFSAPCLTGSCWDLEMPSRTATVLKQAKRHVLRATNFSAAGLFWRGLSLEAEYTCRKGSHTKKEHLYMEIDVLIYQRI